jgi:glycosyltransferase involved in cell wall biosynthesis
MASPLNAIAASNPGQAVAIVCHSHPSLSKGGAEVAAYSLFTGLRALGHDPIFVTACAEQDSAKLAFATSREFGVYYNPLLYDHFYHAGSPTAAQQLREVLVSQRINLVNFHHFLHFGIGSLYTAATALNLDVVVTLHEFLAICQNHGQMITRPAGILCERATPTACATCFPERTRQQFTFRRNLFLNTLGAAKACVAPSAFLAGRFAEWGLDADAITVIENGLTHAIAHTPPRPRHEGQPWVFGFFGQINPFKGVDLILKAAEQIARSKTLSKRIRLRIHGNFIGQSEAFIRRFETLVETHDCLSYAGPYDNAGVGRLMSDCDYVLVPSQWWENSPVVIQEAYGAGRPVICTGIGGMAEKVIDGVSGLHFRRGDVADLVRVLGLAADAALYAQLVAGLPRVSSAAEMASAYLRVFAQAARPAPAEQRKPDGPTHDDSQISWVTQRKRG